MIKANAYSNILYDLETIELPKWFGGGYSNLQFSPSLSRENYFKYLHFQSSNGCTFD